LTVTIDLPARLDVPIEERWDLTTIYPTDEAWAEEAATVPGLIERAGAHRGRLGESADSLKTALDDSMALRMVLERLYIYAKLRSDEDIRDTEGLGRIDRATALSIAAGEALAFFDPELLALPGERLDALIDDPLLATYHHQLDDLRRQRAHTRSVEVEEVLAQSADLARIPGDVFNVLDNADLEFGTIEDESGATVALTKARYQLYLESKNREVRRAAYQGLMQRYYDHRHTLATTHASMVRKDLFYSRVRNHPTSRAAALFNNNIPESVYDSLIAATREAQPALLRYFDLRRRMLGLADLQLYDMYVPLNPQADERYSYDEAREIVLRGVARLGDRYVQDLHGLLHSRRVDVRETRGKRSGGYCWGAYGRPPVILMNWNDTLDAVYTLAHEAGHAMHSYYADASQPFHDAQYSIFLAEIASTLNEVFLTWQLLSERPEQDAAGRFRLLNRLADAINHTLVRQVMFAEFEHRTHATVEAGEPLTLDSLNAIYEDVLGAYVPGVVIDDLARQHWSRIPHFYGAFYVFQYATGISAAIAMATKIRDEGQPAADRYLEMLRAGGSDYPLALLQRAGVDLTNPAPVRAALAELDRLVGEMTAIYESGALGSSG
jgi:oligoendopeptidase F